MLTPHTQFGLHSQFVNIDYMEDFNKEPFVYINPAAAKAKNIAEGDMVKVFNKIGNVTVKG